MEVVESRVMNDNTEAAENGPYYLLADFDAEHVGGVVFSEDSSRLNQLGYKQELNRALSFLANFSVTFSIISVMTGITTLYNQGLSFGGPITMVYGWPIVGLMTMIVGLSMAEICSAYPTAAGLYFWSAKLCGNEWGPFASWLTGCVAVKKVLRVGKQTAWQDLRVLFVAKNDSHLRGFFLEHIFACGLAAAVFFGFRFVYLKIGFFR